MSDINTQLLQIKIKNRVFHVFKYYIIHCYPPELQILMETLSILEQKYFSGNNLIFIQKIKQHLLSQLPNGTKLLALIQNINEMQCYDLYEDIINVLEI